MPAKYSKTGNDAAVEAVKKFAVLEDQPELDEDSVGVFRANSEELLLVPNRNVRQKRTATQRENDLVEIVPLYLAGYSQMQLTDHLNSIREYQLGRPQICRDIKEIYRRWQLSYLKGINELKLRELARVDRVENEYWEAWERSRQDFLSVSKNEIVDEVSKRNPKTTEDVVLDDEVMNSIPETGVYRQTHRRVKTTSKKEQRDGNYKFLEGIQWCINKRCEILGLNAATNINVNWRMQAKSEGIDPDQIIDLITEKMISGAQDAEE